MPDDAPNTLAHGRTIAQRYTGLRGSPAKVEPTPPGIMMLVGYPSCGKTYFAESIPNNYILNFDKSSTVNPGSVALRFPLDDDKSALSWDDFEQEVAALKTLAREGKPRPECITLDSLTTLCQTIKDWIPPNSKKIALRSRDAPDTDNWNLLEGKAAFFWLYQRVVRLIMELNQAGYRVLILGHLRDGDATSPSVSCYPGLWESLKALPEFIGFMEPRDTVVSETVEIKQVVAGKERLIPQTSKRKVRRYSIVVLREGHLFLKGRFRNLQTDSFDVTDNPWKSFVTQYMENK